MDKILDENRNARNNICFLGGGTWNHYVPAVVETVMKRIGLIINPVAGIGGKVGLKGSDGAETLEKALKLGAVPESGDKAFVTIKKMCELKDEMDIYTYPGEMGADICSRADMKLVKVNGGYSIAVYKDNKDIAEGLLGSGRVNFIARADYSKGSALEKTVRDIISKMVITDSLVRENRKQLDEM